MDDSNRVKRTVHQSNVILREKIEFDKNHRYGLKKKEENKPNQLDEESSSSSIDVGKESTPSPTNQSLQSQNDGAASGSIDMLLSAAKQLERVITTHLWFHFEFFCHICCLIVMDLLYSHAQ